MQPCQYTLGANVSPLFSESHLLQVTLLDSLQKRCRFVEDVARHLGLGNVDVAASRAEAAGREPQMREVAL